MNRREKVRGNYPWPGCHKASCELSLSLGRKGLYAHRGSMSHGSWEKSANLWELPAKFFLFCFALRALLLSIAQLWPVLLFLSRGTAGVASLHPGESLEKIRLFAVLNGCSLHCLPRDLHLKLFL